MSEAKQSMGRVFFEIKMKFSIEKSDEALLSTEKLQKTQIFIADVAIHSRRSDSNKKLNLR